MFVGVFKGPKKPFKKLSGVWCVCWCLRRSQNTFEKICFLSLSHYARNMKLGLIPGSNFSCIWDYPGWRESFSSCNANLIKDCNCSDRQFQSAHKASSVSHPFHDLSNLIRFLCSCLFVQSESISCSHLGSFLIPSLERNETHLYASLLDNKELGIRVDSMIPFQKRESMIGR